MLLTEGIGLWLRKTWAEWLTVIASASLIPFELWHLFFGKHHSPLAVLAATTLNVIIVIYLARQLAPPYRRGTRSSDATLNPRLRSCWCCCCWRPPPAGGWRSGTGRARRWPCRPLLPTCCTWAA